MLARLWGVIREVWSEMTSLRVARDPGQSIRTCRDALIAPSVENPLEIVYRCTDSTTPVGD